MNRQGFHGTVGARSSAVLLMLAMLAGASQPAAAGQGGSAFDQARFPPSEGCTLEGRVTEDPLPFGLGPCPGVRPGGLVLIDDWAHCTLNYLFVGYRRDEHGNVVEDGRYMGTAGHCALHNGGGEHVFAPGEAPVGYGYGPGPDPQRLGEFAYAVGTYYPNPPGDFALLKLDEGVEADPQMCHFGGPTGIHDPDFNSSPGIVQHYGWGHPVVWSPHFLGPGWPVHARSGYAASSGPANFLAFMVTSSGDSGSPVQTEDGRAVGLMISTAFAVTNVIRLRYQVERAAEKLGLESLELQTAPML